MKFKGAVFDLDGTLLDSMEVWKNIDIEFLSNRAMVYSAVSLKLMANISSL